MAARFIFVLKSSAWRLTSAKAFEIQPAKIKGPAFLQGI
jgi:hypothetical protein